MTTKTKEPEITLDAGHVYRVNGIVRPGVTSILKDCGLIPDFANEEAMLRGKAVHRACELLDLGTLDWSSVRDEFMPYMTAYEEALEKYRLTPIPEFIERKVYHPYCLYAGTLDRVYRAVNGDLILTDIKTGTSIPDYAGEQTAAYKDALLALGYQVADRAVLLLKPDGSPQLQYLTDPNDEQIWMSCVNLYRRKHG